MYEYGDIGEVRGRLPDFQIDCDHVAMLCIDMQYWFASSDTGYGIRAQAGQSRGRFPYYFDRLATQVIPNNVRLLESFRSLGLPRFLVRVATRTRDSADTSWRYKQWGLLVPPDAHECQILEELGPKPGDIVLDKTTSSVFLSTNLDFVLRNIGITSLVITGVSTNGCVESSTRTAGDLGYKSYLIADATATYTPELHEESLSDMDHNFAIVKSTEEVLGELKARQSMGGAD